MRNRALKILLVAAACTLLVACPPQSERNNPWDTDGVAYCEPRLVSAVIDGTGVANPEDLIGRWAGSLSPSVQFEPADTLILELDGSVDTSYVIDVYVGAATYWPGQDKLYIYGSADPSGPWSVAVRGTSGDYLVPTSSNPIRGTVQITCRYLKLEGTGFEDVDIECIYAHLPIPE